MEELLSQISEDIHATAKEILGKQITEEELYQAAVAMALSKCPGPNGIIAEFFKVYWPLIGEEFTQMISHSISRGAFPLA